MDGSDHAPEPETRTPWRYQPVDVLTMGYAALVFLAVALLGGDLPNQAEDLAFYFGVFVVVRLGVPFARRSSSGPVRFLADVYPLALYTFFYLYANRVNTIVFADHVPFDRFFGQLDQTLFGVKPSFWLARTFGTPLVHEVVHFFYATYYLMIPMVSLVYYFTRRRDPIQYQRLLFTVCFTFYACYVVFIVLPVHGPNLLRGDDYSGGVLFVPIMDWLYAEAETGGGAFPSSHVAVALVCLIFAARHSRWLLTVWLIPFVGLAFATVYCRYHYAVDTLAGLVWGALLYRLGVGIYDGWLGRAERRASADEGG